MKYSILFIAFAFVVACKPAAEKPAAEAPAETTPTEATVDKTGPEYTSAYICPMHCKGSGSDKAGVCPVCGMDYVMNDKKEEATDHEGHDHEGHDHNENDGHTH